MLTQDGKARAYGGQFSIRRRFANGFTGWLSYTITHSEVRYHPTSEWVHGDYEQPHLFTGVASYDIGRRLHGRSALARDLRSAPNAREQTRLRHRQRRLSAAVRRLQQLRLPNIYALDVRIDKTFQLGRRKLIMFLDALNVLNRPPAEEILYDPT